MFALLTLAMAMQGPPTPVGPVPTEAQIQWQRNEYVAFVHFGPNTFTGQEWGHGTEDPKMFNPTAFDANQWAKTFKDAGMTAVIITAKHHDGFCLWPSKYSTHTVAQSPFKRDVLKELSDACKKYGLGFGVYLSPWDRNHPKYGTDEYNQIFANTLTEVLTSYGKVTDVWFDGANGEGPNGRRQVYDWPLFNGTVFKHQPDAIIFSDAGPGCRWVGNEDGYAGETSWSTITKADFAPGKADTKILNMGDPTGKDWVPSESDVSIRPGWFWKEEQNKDVKSVDKLMDIWYGSVGRNSHLLLNVPPDKRGLIHEIDAQRLLDFKKRRDEIFKTNLAHKVKVTASSTRSARWTAAKIVDGDWESYWAAPEANLQAEIVLDFEKETRADHIVIQEQIRYGQRIKQFSVHGKVGEDWIELTKGTTVGYKRILKFAPVDVTAIKVKIEDAKASPTLNNVAVYASPEAKNAVIESPAEKAKRLEWWKEARFGMFIHWGLYAIPAGEWNGQKIPGIGEWIMNTAKITPEEYDPLKNQFNPTKYDAKEWVRIANDAGMKYIVITSKHHDGFGLWDSKLTNWDIAATPYKLDLLKPLAEECEKAGIVLCFYHSIMDWTHPDYLPRREWDKRPGGDMDKYTEFMKGQLKELLTNYGRIGILWFDGQWENTWTHDRGMDLYKYVRSLQPNIIINNRVDKGALLGGKVEHAGDYGTPEQWIPANGLPGIDWEACMTMNDTWGWKKDDNNWKTAKTLIENLVDCVSKGGNYLLNVGPTPEGEIPPQSVERLAEIGKWLRKNGEAVYGANAGPFNRPQPWGRVTSKPGKLYLHVFDPTARLIPFPSIKTRITKMYRLSDNAPIHVMTLRSNPSNRSLELPAQRDASVGVYVLEYQGNLEVEQYVIRPAEDGSITLPASEADLDGGVQYESAKDSIGFWMSENATVKWPFQLTKAGRFKLSIEVGCPENSAGSEVQIEIGGDQKVFKVPATGDWDKFVTLDLGEISLVRPGRLMATVKALKKPGMAVMNLRSVKLVPVR